MRAAWTGLASGIVAFFAACSTPSNENLAPVTSGTIGGVAFTVSGGSVIQPIPDGPIYGDAAGALVVLDQNVLGLGMSDPDRLHLRTQFAVSDNGTLGIAAFGHSDDPLGSGSRITITRSGALFTYEFWFGGARFADDEFTPSPMVPSGEHWVVTEFYAQDVPAYGAGSGAAMWGIDDLSPAFAGDVLGCASGPAMQATPLPGDRVAYSLRTAFLVSVEVVDTIVGPCS